VKESEVKRYLLYFGERPLLTFGADASRVTDRRRLGGTVAGLLVLVLAILLAYSAFSSVQEGVVASGSAPVTSEDIQAEQNAAIPAAFDAGAECKEFCVLFKQFLHAIEVGLSVNSS
jgi:hypothetical protein